MSGLKFSGVFLNKCARYMYLKIFIDSDDMSLKSKYIEYINERELKMQKDPEHIDAGFDIFVPHEVLMNNNLVNKLDFMISCSAQIFEISKNENEHREINIYKTHNTGYYMYPRSSISKTNLRLANNVGIIDAGYRGHLMGMFDILYHQDVVLQVNKFDRLLQICAPELMPIYVELVDTKDELGDKTIRGDGGFGSTGV